MLFGKCKNTFAFLVVLALASGVGACSDDQGDLLFLNGVGYRVVNAGSLAHNNTNVTGTGSIVFNSPLSSIQSANSYALSFVLADGGSLVLVANSKDDVTNGAETRFSRSGSVLSVKFIVGGSETDVSSSFTSINASGTITLQVDVHNNESPAHVLAWTGSDFSEGAALVNSEDAGKEVPGNGSGTYWGLRLTDATVTSASVGAAKFSE